MKLFAVVLLCVSSALADEGTGRFRGDYVGLLLPIGNVCTTERWIMAAHVEPDGHLTGKILSFDDQHKAELDCWLPASGGFAFNSGTNIFHPTEEAGNGWLIRGGLNLKAGTMRGILDARARGGCKYSFVLYRRFRNN